MGPTLTPKTVIAFDLYGTLLSTSSISTKLSGLLSIPYEKAKAIAELWRRYQLEYTWRLTSMNNYAPFSAVTLSSFRHALRESEVTTPVTETLEQAILEAYDSLETFPDAATGLELLSGRDHLEAYVFSNGTPSMISNSVNRSPSLSAYSSVFKDLVSVEEVETFKPAPAVYRHLAQRVGKDGTSKEEMGSIWLVSSNPFDVVGARNVGMKVAWIDRIGKGWVDSLTGGGQPNLIVTGVDDAVKLIEDWRALMAKKEGSGESHKV